MADVVVPPALELDYRGLMERVEGIVDKVRLDTEERPGVLQLADAIVRELGQELGFSGGRLYLREGDAYRLWATFGGARPASPGIVVSGTYGPLQQVYARGTVYAQADDPSLDRELEDRLGANAFAALEVGDREYLLAFDLTPDHRRDQVLFALSLLRHSLSQRMRRERMEDALRQARRIQSSILPRVMPRFGDFEVAASSHPLESVGGDFFDLIPITDKILGVAIADVSGHGLPAALQVRDIYMGLRMGMARDFKIIRTVERLNQIIHLSTMTSRFVSMVYGELEIDGTFIFCNAGHPPPFHMDAAGEVRFLDKGGVVLGPLPEATYTRGYLTMSPEDVLVLCTDGILETARVRKRGDSNPEEYGIERLVELVRSVRSQPAARIADAIFADVEAFAAGSQPSDDRTLVVIKRPGPTPS